MSAAAEAKTIEAPRADTQWARWTRQIVAIVRIELRKNFLGLRAVLIYLLAALPIGLLMAMVVFPPTARKLAEAGTANLVYAGMFEGLILRTVVFFGCAWIFMNLFRGEIVDRSLHYYFLSAVRREVLVAGKYISGVMTSVVLFGAATFATLVLLYIPRGFAATGEYLFQGPGLRYAATYLFITALGCVGYGAFFIAIGLLFRNPILPALALFGWEWINFLLPPVLKKISVVHYLQSLSPISFSEGPFAIVAEPTPAYIAVPAMFCVSAVFLAFTAWWARRMEVTYAGD